MLDGSMRHLGTFERKIVAALHYDQAAIESFDQFAYNFPNLSRMISEGGINIHFGPERDDLRTGSYFGSYS